MKNMKILITGGAGFIGSNLCEKLIKDKKNDVYSLDNYFTGSKNNHVKNVTYIEGNTIDIDSLISFSPDVIFHLGEYSRVEQSFEDADKVWEFNSKSIFSILNFALKHQAKLIYAGSSTKFGNGNEPCNSSPYAWSKSSNIDLICNYGKWFNLSYAITYFYNVYGKNEISNGEYATLIGKFKSKHLNKEVLEIVSPGSQMRNFTHVDDIVNGLELVAKHGIGDGYSIGSKKSYSIFEVAEMFGSKIKMLENRKGNRMGGMIKTDKIEKLGWNCKKRLRPHIKKFIAEN